MECDNSIDEVIENKGLNLVHDDSFINNVIDKVLIENNKLVTDYKNGNTRVAKALMGLIMKETKGSIDPSTANIKLMEKLNN